MIHHIAIQTKNPLQLAEFYKKIPNLRLIKVHHYEKSKKIRSIWLKDNSGGMLFLEEGKKPQAPFALIFSYQKSMNHYLKKHILDWKKTSRTSYTIYFPDPDGNTIGFSSYPDRLDSIKGFGKILEKIAMKK